MTLTFFSLCRLLLRLVRWAALCGLGAGTAAAMAAPAPGGTTFEVIATAVYTPAGLTQLETTRSNTAAMVVASVEVAATSPDQHLKAPAGAGITLSQQLTNLGNVPSTYRISWSAGGAACGVSSVLPLGAMKVVRDINSNGVAEPSEPEVPLDQAGALSLQPGESITLLALGTLPVASSGSVCAKFSATTALQAVVASSLARIDVSDAASLAMYHSAVYSAPVLPGSTRIDYAVRGVNIGSARAQALQATPSGSAILIDGRPASVILIQAAVPAGTTYVAGSLATSLPTALKLFRLPGDAPFSYRTRADDAAATELAIALQPPSVDPAVGYEMRFAVTATDGAGVSRIDSLAQAYYSDGTEPSVRASNLVAIPVAPPRIGVAEWALPPQARPDGTADVVLFVRVKNYGSTWLHDVQLHNLLEGAGATQFGQYTAAAVPAAGQYTLVPGSISVQQPNGSVAGQVANVNTAFNGTAAQPQLLQGGAVLPIGGDLTLRLVVRFNTTGRDQTLLNSTVASAALGPGGARVAVDDSVNGTDPDPTGTGLPGLSASPTPVAAQQPLLVLTESVSLPRYAGPGVFDVDVLFKVVNNGGAAAQNLRVIGNLNCTFSMDRPDGPVQKWELLGPVRTGGLLRPAATFTGNAPCNRAQWEAGHARQFPTEIALSLVDGSQALGAGQTEQVGFTVRVTAKDAASAERIVFVNRAWAVAFGANAVNVDNGLVAASASSMMQLAATAVTSAQGLLVDPQGTVYDAVSRRPLAGVSVNLRRQSCDAGSVGPIVASELFNGDSGLYTYETDGSVSMKTSSDGAWQFYFVASAVSAASGRCTYAVSVTPPTGSGYLFPARRIPPEAGTFTRCGAVLPQANPPADGQATTYYTQVAAGTLPNGELCEVLNNHLPLDPGLENGLMLRKYASRQQVEFGEFLDYALTVTNKTGFNIKTALTFNDTLPPGFAYVPGSARLQGVAVADPAGGVGPSLAWQLQPFEFLPDQVAMLRYRVRVGVGARVSGTAVNRAQVTAKGYRSNAAEHTVRVNGGVFSDEAFAFGKVYLNCQNRPEQEGEAEPGIPGVRLWLEDGTNVVTDAEGRWSLYGLSAKTHVLRLDETTLPAGTQAAVLDNRNAGTASSRFADLKKGEFHKANFPVEGCQDPAVRQAVEARRAAAAKSRDTELSTALRARLDAKSAAVVSGDTRGLPAAGQVNGGGSGTAMTTPTDAASGPLIRLGSGVAGGRAGGSSFLSAGEGQSTGTLALAEQGRVGAAPAVATGQVPAAGVGAQAAGQPGGVTQGLLPQPAAPSSVELETLMLDLDKTPGFVDLRDGDTLPSQVVNVRVKGPAGTQLRLSVNGQVIDQRRVGKKASLGRTGAGAWEYIGVPMTPGKNLLRLQVVDDLGIERGAPVELSVVAPDKLGVLRLELPAEARADGRTAVPVTLHLTDAAGVPVTARTLVTLEAEGGRWTEDDLNPQEPGLQTFVQGGKATFHLVPPGVLGVVRLRATVNTLVQDAQLTLLPDLRPMIAVGLVEGTLDLSRRGPLSLGQVPAGAAFEQELRSLGAAGDNSRAGARAAFFLKGAIRGDYLLTAALDTDKARKDRLFRDIRPDEFYPVYGDSSERGYDAQSSQRLYVRIDKNRSYLLYGDFTTSSSAEVRKLSQTSRTLTGVKGVYEDAGTRVTSYAARTTQQQRIEELPARGVSGPYYLSPGAGGLVENSEVVELISRDRNQPSVILRRTTLTRLVDYTIEPSLGRLMFLNPVASVDADLHPQSLRITYETDAGGASYTVAGIDAQVAVNDRLQAGVVAHMDDDPKAPRRLAAVTALARVTDHTSLAAEAVRTHSDDKGSGTASRVEVRHQAGALGLSAQASTASSTFDNPAAGIAAGSTQSSVRAEYRIDETLAARAEATYARNDGAGDAARGQSASVLKKLSPDVAVEVGVRHGATNGGTSGSGLFTDVGGTAGQGGALAAGGAVAAVGAVGGTAGAGENDLLTVRARITATLPGSPQAQVFAEAEQDTRDSGRRIAALGGSYALTDKTRLYGRYELASSLYDIGTRQSRNVGLFGVESNYMAGGRVFNEYRVADSSASRNAQLASGVRQTVKLGDHWQVTGGVERSRALGGVEGAGLQAGLGNATALTSGVEYSRGDWRATGVLEARRGSDAHALLNSLGLGYRLGDDWTLLARSIYNASRGVGSLAGNERIQTRQQLGAAYRPADDDRWNALARYEHREERISGTTPTASAASVAAFGSDASLPGTYVADVLSLHGNYSPKAGNTFSARLALKVASMDDGLLKSRYAAQLLYGRWTRDLSNQWDIGLQAGLLRGSGGALQKAFGVEAGYLLGRDLWLSAGYNFIGLSDRDLTAGEYTQRGVYLRLRFKFDESSLGLQSGAASPSREATAAAVGVARRRSEAGAASGLVEVPAQSRAETKTRPTSPLPSTQSVGSTTEGTDS